MFQLENKESSGLSISFSFFMCLNPWSQASEQKSKWKSTKVMASLCLGEDQNVLVREACVGEAHQE